MKRSFRLTRSNDIQRVRRIGKSYAHPLVVLSAVSNSQDGLRIAVVASGRVGGAVQRNRAKRQMRAILHTLVPDLKPGWDLIFIARQSMTQASFTEIQQAISQLVRRAGLLKITKDDSLSASGLSG